MRLRALNDYVIVKLDDDQWMYSKKPDLIHIPEAVVGRFKKKSQWATVVSFGKKCTKDYTGSRVYFMWYDNRPGIQNEHGDFRFLKEREILLNA